MNREAAGTSAQIEPGVQALIINKAAANKMTADAKLFADRASCGVSSSGNGMAFWTLVPVM